MRLQVARLPTRKNDCNDFPQEAEALRVPIAAWTDRTSRFSFARIPPNRGSRRTTEAQRQRLDLFGRCRWRTTLSRTNCTFSARGF